MTSKIRPASPLGTFVAPDHSYPSHLELVLTATDAYGLSRTVTRRLDPRTVPITVASDPAGVALTLGTETAIAPLTLEVIEGSQLPVTAPSQATVNGETYDVRRLERRRRRGRMTSRSEPPPRPTRRPSSRRLRPSPSRRQP